MKNRNILDRMKSDVVLGAQGYLFELERRGYVKAGLFVPEVVLEYPEAVKELHREFLRAGSEVMVALTYYAHRQKMTEAGLKHNLEALNRAAVRIAKEVASEGEALVAGNLSNTWLYDSKHPDKSEKRIRPMFEEQVGWAQEEGVDFFIAETFSHLGEALIALKVIKENNGTALVTFIPIREISEDGYTWEEACKKLEHNGADIVGLNCGRGPATMFHLLKRIRESVVCYTAAQPAPYRTTDTHPSFRDLRDREGNKAFPVGLDPFLHTRFEMADFALDAKRAGINYIGICCGGAPHHVRAMAEALGRKVPASKYSIP
ncbi:MAG: homocysteine S-methyltransferase family protein [Desulfatiglandaceae bacterium]